MSPYRIAERAAGVGLDMIAVCDHNSSENAPAVVKAGESARVAVIPGMEITSSEEVHIIGLFPTLSDATAAQEVVFNHLPGHNDEEVFGTQVVANELDEVLYINNKLLIGATELSLNEVVDLIHRHSGLAIASHIDREGLSIIGKLGFIPDDLPLDALELSSLASGREAVPGDDLGRWPIVRSSDAHCLDEIGSARTSFFFAETSFDELGMALRGESGRRVEA